MSSQDPYIAFLEYVQRYNLFAGRKTAKSSLRERTVEGGRSEDKGRYMQTESVSHESETQMVVKRWGSEYLKDGEGGATRRCDRDEVRDRDEDGRRSAGLKLPKATAAEKLCAEVWLYSELSAIRSC